VVSAPEKLPIIKYHHYKKSTNSKKSNISRIIKLFYKNKIYTYPTFFKKLETIYDYSKGARGLSV